MNFELSELSEENFEPKLNFCVSKVSQVSHMIQKKTKANSVLIFQMNFIKIT